MAGIGVVFTIARFSEAFLVLKAAQVGLPVALVPLVMMLINLFYAVLATLAGMLFDRIDRGRFSLPVLQFSAPPMPCPPLLLVMQSYLSESPCGVPIWN